MQGTALGGGYFGQYSSGGSAPIEYAAEPREFFMVDPVERFIDVPQPADYPVEPGFSYFEVKE